MAHKRSSAINTSVQLGDPASTSFTLAALIVLCFATALVLSAGGVVIWRKLRSRDIRSNFWFACHVIATFLTLVLYGIAIASRILVYTETVVTFGYFISGVFVVFTEYAAAVLILLLTIEASRIPNPTKGNSIHTTVRFGIAAVIAAFFVAGVGLEIRYEVYLIGNGDDGEYFNELAYSNVADMMQLVFDVLYLALVLEMCVFGAAKFFGHSSTHRMILLLTLFLLLCLHALGVALDVCARYDYGAYAFISVNDDLQNILQAIILLLLGASYPASGGTSGIAF